MKYGDAKLQFATSTEAHFGGTARRLTEKTNTYSDQSIRSTHTRTSNHIRPLHAGSF